MTIDRLESPSFWFFREFCVEGAEIDREAVASESTSIKRGLSDPESAQLVVPQREVGFPGRGGGGIGLLEIRW